LAAAEVLARRTNRSPSNSPLRAHHPQHFLARHAENLYDEALLQRKQENAFVIARKSNTIAGLIAALEYNGCKK
jgi:hypothetical protein